MSLIRKFVVSILAAGSLLACASAPVSIPTEGPVQALVSRVVSRHDVYVEADQSLSEEERGQANADSVAARLLMTLPEVSPSTLGLTMDPVMERHDRYVRADQELDELERGVYLSSTERLRSLVAAFPALVPAE